MSSAVRRRAYGEGLPEPREGNFWPFTQVREPQIESPFLSQCRQGSILDSGIISGEIGDAGPLGAEGAQRGKQIVDILTVEDFGG